LVGAAPYLYVLRTVDAVLCRRHADVADDVANAFEGLCKRRRGRPGQWAREYGDYVGLLASAAPIGAIRAGPLYRVAHPVSPGEACVAIDESNADLLRGGLDEWSADVKHSQPMMAVVAGRRAIAVCASVRASETVHCAGVETLPDYRRTGLGAQVVGAWAGAVQARGATPFYGTTFDNLASQGVARRLGLDLVGSEFWIELSDRN